MIKRDNYDFFFTKNKKKIKRKIKRNEGQAMK